MEKIGYGLCTTENCCFFSAGGDLYMLRHDGDDKDKLYEPELVYKKLHEKEINDIKAFNGFLLTVSNDMTIKVINLETRIVEGEMKFPAEINSVDCREGQIILGLDSGEISLLEMGEILKNTGEPCAISKDEKIVWHKSPISLVRFLSNDAFISMSDEQAVLWDLSFDDEWEYHKYLHFVHAGQNFYKDCDVFDEMVVTVSLDGLCFFTPVGGI
ncbi:hypothetical protein EQH57_0918 [Dictyocoela roeselum]|nr:hypothetical protein EQH57_0918 [Dictyocoela roeselum]